MNIDKSYIKLILAAIIGGLIALGTYKLFDSNSGLVIQRVEPSYKSLATKYEGALDEGIDFSEVAEIANPAVVHITSTITSTNNRRQNNNRIPEEFREFFGDSPFGGRFDVPRGPQQGTGSGVIISENGYIVTNNHVIDNASDIEVVLYDKRSYKAKLIGTDRNTDLALLQIKENNLPALKFGNSDNVKVGEWVLAVGNPFNLTSTVTAGIVSAKGRSINILQEEYAIESFIQTDAAVNPGNSGGALVNTKGQLIGINTAIATRTGTFSGYSFAVPANIVMKVIEDLKLHGSVQRGVLGIRGGTASAALAKEKKLGVNQGAYVAEVVPNSGAAESGIKAEDVIVEVEGKKIKSMPELQERIARKRPGDKIELKVNRFGKIKTLTVTLKGLDGSTEIASTSSNSNALQKLGAELQDLTEKEKKVLGVSGGVKVTRLKPGALRNQTDVKEGFVITKVNNTYIKTIKDLEKALSELEDGGVLLEGVYEKYPGKYYYGFGM